MLKPKRSLRRKRQKKRTRAPERRSQKKRETRTPLLTREEIAESLKIPKIRRKRRRSKRKTTPLTTPPGRGTCKKATLSRKS
ncbi:MAG: hypothetical protein BWY86_00544 [Candidatus Aminicenantes bacterium ADurb.Bin508]|nr:MAG: hypothetical protein BWY86_00544 [Candidatus Aminicenantes bacterium ADurb.Bin508]